MFISGDKSMHCLKFQGNSHPNDIGKEIAITRAHSVAEPADLDKSTMMLIGWDVVDDEEFYYLPLLRSLKYTIPYLELSFRYIFLS